MLAVLFALLMTAVASSSASSPLPQLPPPVGGNTRDSLSADDDGGPLKELTRAYYKAGVLSLPR